MNRIVSAVLASACVGGALGIMASASGENRVPGADSGLFSSVPTPEALAAAKAVAPRGGVVPCYELTISFHEEPVSGLSAVMRMRGTDLDFDGDMRSDAGGYGIYVGPDEVEQCVVTVYRGGIERTFAPVLNSVFVNADYFYFNWAIGSGALSGWDTGAPSGAFLVGGADLPGGLPNGSYVNPDVNEVVDFPAYTLTSVPCVCAEQACGPDALELEFEPDCGLPVDTVNGGCNSAPFLATPIELGQTVCGTGSWDGEVRDTDWYELTLTATTTVAVRVRAGFDLGFGVVAEDVCTSGNVLVGTSLLACEEGEVVRTLPAGTYYVVASADFFGPEVPCGSRYQLSVERRCPGDINLSGATDTGDFNIFAGNFGDGPGATREDGDLTGDGFVNTADFNIMAGDFGCTL